MKAAIMGILIGLTAVIAMRWLGPPAPAIREMAADPLTGQQAMSGRFLPTPSAAEVTRKLARVLPSVKCDATPLAKFIAWFEDSTGINVYIEWRDLAAAVGPESPVTLDVRNISAGAALQLALDQAPLAGPGLGYAVLDGIVKVSTTSRLDRAMIVRVYDVRDLIEALVDLKLRLERKSMPYIGAADREADAAFSLQDQIGTSPPWQTWGDGAETISYLGGRMVVSQTKAGHEAIAAILAELRARVGPR
jgi:hypothetical protein